MTTQSDCRHITLRMTKWFDQPEPVECRSCKKSFSIPDAVAHMLALEPIIEAERKADPVTYTPSSIDMGYAMAHHIEGDDGIESFFIPDLDIDIAAEDYMFPTEILHDVIWIKIEEHTESGKPLPVPRSIAELKEAYPSQSEWEWSGIPLNITEYLHQHLAKFQPAA